MLLRLKLVGLIYVPLRCHKDVLNRSVVLTYSLRRRDDVSAWSRTFKQVAKIGELLLCTYHWSLRWLSLFKVLLVRCCNASKTSILFRYQLLRRFKLVNLIYVPVIRCKEVSNRSISLTYQLWRRLTSQHENFNLVFFLLFLSAFTSSAFFDCSINSICWIAFGFASDSSCLLEPTVKNL